jgi:hypothetical protein
VFVREQLLLRLWIIGFPNYDKAKAGFAARQHRGRFGGADEIAEAACSAGAMLAADGGMRM